MNKEYKTTDFDFASLLYCMDKKFKNLENLGVKKVFVFDDDGTIDEIRLKYVRKELKIEPKKLWNSIRAMKSIIHGEI